MFKTSGKRVPILIPLHMTLITFNDVGQFLTDNWIEYKRFPKTLEVEGYFRKIGEYLRGLEKHSVSEDLRNDLEGFIKL